MPPLCGIVYLIFLMVLKKVLLVEDEEPTLEGLKKLFEMEGYSVDTATDLKTAKEKVSKYYYPIIILDLLLPDGNGTELLEYVDTKKSKVIILTAHGNIETTTKTIKLGAFDFITKPVSFKELKLVCQKALEVLSSEGIDDNYSNELLNEIVGVSSFVQNLKEKLPKIAYENKNVLIFGEEGVGKTFIAKLIHKLSPRRDFKIFRILPADKSELELEMEIFGSTLPKRNKIGALELAEGGTVILSRIEQFPITVQKKLAEAIRTRSYTPVGSGGLRGRLNVRFIVTTSKNPNELLANNIIDADFLQAINQTEIYIPSLKERKEDIIPLFDYFLGKISKEEGLKKPILTDEVKEVLINREYKGNVKELKTLATLAVILFHGKIVEPSKLCISPEKVDKDDLFELGDIRKAREKFEKAFLKKALIECKGDVRKVAQLVGLDISNVYRKIRTYNLERYTKNKSS